MSTDRHIDTNRLDQVYKDMETAREQAKSINDLKNAITKARRTRSIHNFYFDCCRGTQDETPTGVW